MIWHSFPTVPEYGSHILVYFKGCQENGYVEMVMREPEGMGYIEKWCYFDDYKEFMERKVKNEKIH